MRGSTSKCLVVPRGRNKCKNGDAGFLASGSQLLIYLPLREAEPCNPGFCMASSFPLDSARNGCQGCLQDGRSLSQIASCDSQLPPTTLGTLHPPSNSSCLPVAAAESIFPRTHHQQVPTISRYSASAGTHHQQVLSIAGTQHQPVPTISSYSPSYLLWSWSQGAGLCIVVWGPALGAPLVLLFLPSFSCFLALGQQLLLASASEMPSCSLFPSQ